MRTAEQYRISNFGPIRDATLEMAALTFFVGPQGTGKSLSAQVLCFLRSLEYYVSCTAYWSGQSLAQNYARNPDPIVRFCDALRFWLGNDPQSYAHKNTYIQWTQQATEYRLNYSLDTNSGMSVSVHMNDLLDARIRSAAKTTHLQTPNKNHHLYIPAGRMICSFIMPRQAEFILKFTKIEWPGYLDVFYQALQRSLESLAEENKESMRREQKPLQILSPELEHVLGGRLLHSGGDNIMFTVEDRLAPSDGFSRSYGFDQRKLASGQMEIWPLLAMLQRLLKSETSEEITIYIEEPEAHLHPGAQYALLREIASLVNRGLRFVIITHSPHMLMAANELLKASQSPRDIRASENTALKAQLKSDQVQAYSFKKTGYVDSIYDQMENCIITSELDTLRADVDLARLATKSVPKKVT